MFYAAEPASSAPRPAVTGRPTDDELAAMDAALGDQPRHLAAVLTGSWRAPGWQGPAVPAGWQQALAVTDLAARALGVTLVRRSAEQVPWHPGRCAEIATSDGVVIGYAGELHPAGHRGVRAPGADRCRGDRPVGAARRGPAAGERGPDLVLPGGQGGRGPDRRRVEVPAADGGVGAASTAPARCWSRWSCSTSTPARRSARDGSRWPSPCGSGRRTVPSPTPRAGPPETWLAVAVEPSQEVGTPIRRGA